MSTLDLVEALKAIHEGIRGSYISPFVYDKVPSKEILREAKLDLEAILASVPGSEANKDILRLRKLSEIVELLIDIPEQTLIQTKEFVAALNACGKYHNVNYPEIIKGTGLGIIVPKYALIGALSKIEFDAAVEQSPGIKKLVEVGKKYLELVNIDRPYDTTAPRS